jgi:hypothetical protein
MFCTENFQLMRDNAEPQFYTVTNSDKDTHCRRVTLQIKFKRMQLKLNSFLATVAAVRTSDRASRTAYAGFLNDLQPCSAIQKSRFLKVIT